LKWIIPLPKISIRRYDVTACSNFFKSSHVVTTCYLFRTEKCYPSLLFTSYVSLSTRRRTGLEQGWVWSEQRRTFIRFDLIQLLFRPRSHGLFQSFPLCIPCSQLSLFSRLWFSTFLPHPNPPSRFFSFWECNWDGNGMIPRCVYGDLTCSFSESCLYN